MEENTGKVKPFNRNDEQFLEAFVIFCGLGIQNTQMYEAVERAMAKQMVTLEVGHSFGDLRAVASHHICDVMVAFPIVWSRSADLYFCIQTTKETETQDTLETCPGSCDQATSQAACPLTVCILGTSRPCPEPCGHTCLLPLLPALPSQWPEPPVLARGEQL